MELKEPSKWPVCCNVLVESAEELEKLRLFVASVNEDADSEEKERREINEDDDQEDGQEDRETHDEDEADVPTGDLSQQERDVFKVVKNSINCTVRKVQKQVGLTRDEARKILGALAGKDLIDIKEYGSATYYKIKEVE